MQAYRPFAEEAVIRTSFGDLHTLIAGKGDKIIIAMHGDGPGSNNECWLPAAVRFAERGIRMLCLSMPGYGKSTGDQYSFRQSGVVILGEVIQKLQLINKPIILGRSVGGRTAISFASQYPSAVSAVILQHPVVPSDGIVSGLRGQRVLLSWAKDDGLFDNALGHATAGHPYFGPHGAKYMQQESGC